MIRRHGLQRLDLAIQILERAGYRATLVATTGPQTAGKIAHHLAEHDGVDTIFVAGGDGTVNEVMNGLVHSDTALGVLPAGTANVLANELKIGAWKEALASVPRLQSVRIPVGRVVTANGVDRYFLMMAGVGFDARMVYSVKPEFKRSLGKLAYWLAGFSQLGKTLEQFSVTIDGATHLASFCLATKVRNYGGDIEIATSVHLSDRNLEVILFEGRFTAEYLVHLLRIVSGRLQTANGIRVLRARHIELHPSSDDPVHLQVDGELAGVLPATISVEPDALTLLVPPEYLERSPGFHP